MRKTLLVTVMTMATLLLCTGSDCDIVVPGYLYGPDVVYTTPTVVVPAPVVVDPYYVDPYYVDYGYVDSTWIDVGFEYWEEPYWKKIR